MFMKALRTHQIVWRHLPNVLWTVLGTNITRQLCPVSCRKPSINLKQLKSFLVGKFISDKGSGIVHVVWSLVIKYKYFSMSEINK